MLSYIDLAKEEGGRILCGGPPTTLPDRCRNGFFVEPTVVVDLGINCRVNQEEIFGPVMTILPYDDSAPNFLDVLIARANDTRMGLAAGVFTRNIDNAHKVIGRVEAGINWVNTWGESPAEMPVGGWKMSGLGVENGPRGLENWVQNKSTLVEMNGAVGTVFAKL